MYTVFIFFTVPSFTHFVNDGILPLVYALIQVQQQIFLAHIVNAKISQIISAFFKEALFMHRTGQNDHGINDRCRNTVLHAQIMIDLTANGYILGHITVVNGVRTGIAFIGRLIQREYHIVIAALLQENMALSFLPEYCVKKLLTDGTLAQVDVALEPQVYYSQILTHKNRWISPFMAGLIEEIKTAYPSAEKTADTFVSAVLGVWEAGAEMLTSDWARPIAFRLSPDSVFSSRNTISRDRLQRSPDKDGTDPCRFDTLSQQQYQKKPFGFRKGNWID